MIATPQAARDGSSAILRVDKTQGRWEAVAKALIEDTRLSLETRAAAIWILARPDGWTICATVLPRLLAVGRSKARRFLRELARAGYLERKLRRGANGRWIWEQVLSAVATTVDQKPVDGSSVDGVTVDGKPVDKRQTEQNTLNQYRFKEPTTTAPNRTDQHVVVDKLQDLTFPPPFDGERRASARQVLCECPAEFRQAILFEVAGILVRGSLKGSPVGLIRKLAERAREGAFVPSQAIAHADKLRRDTERRAREQANIASSVEAQSPENREAALAAIATIRAMYSTKERKQV